MNFQLLNALLEGMKKVSISGTPDRASKHAGSRRKPKDWREKRRKRREIAKESRKKNRR